MGIRHVKAPRVTKCSQPKKPWACSFPKPRPALPTPALHSLTCVNTTSSSQGSWEHAAEVETAAPGEEGTMGEPTARTARAGRAMPKDHSLDSKWRDQSTGKETSPLDLRICNCCCCSVAKLCLTLQPHGLQHPRLPCPSFTIFQSSLKLMSIESVMLSHPPPPLSPFAFNPCQRQSLFQ